MGSWKQVAEIQIYETLLTVYPVLGWILADGNIQDLNHINHAATSDDSCLPTRDCIIISTISGLEGRSWRPKHESHNGFVHS